MGGQGRTSGGTRKYGRNKVKCEKYRRENRRFKAKDRKCRKSNGKPYPAVRTESRQANGLPKD